MKESNAIDLQEVSVHTWVLIMIVYHDAFY
ncbi:hypothetical protein ABIE12_003070 [Serratia sp. 509]